MSEFDHTSLTQKDIVRLLQSNGAEQKKLFAHAAKVKEQYVGNKVFLRGLIEMTNICRKNCYYCGIRSGNANVKRYNLTDDEVVDAAVFAWKNRFGSIAIQTGEVSNKRFVDRVANLLKKINRATNSELGITLSMGEQTEDTYRKWFENGAIRYLLRIETTNRELYKKLHPQNKTHDFDKRIESLQALRKVGYQVGSGVMIGLPFQTLEHLTEDVLWLKGMDLDMIGMGPYIEHHETPLYGYRDMLLPLHERLNLSIKMIAIVRIMMKDVNIVASTALQAIDDMGRSEAIMAGANVVMPNITPGLYRNDYNLYENKPLANFVDGDAMGLLEKWVYQTGNTIGYGEHGNPRHYYSRVRSKS